METLYEWIGYLASFFILVSLIMTSVKRLRLINLVGALLFTIYGYLISAYPVMIMNAGIVIVNLYYLKQIFTSEDFFKTLSVAKDDDYVHALIHFYKDNIQKFMPVDASVLEDSEFRILILRNMDPAGLFVAKPYDESTLEITLDYALPMFQDFKTGAFIYEKERELFKNHGYHKMIAFAKSEKHEKYLKRMGFKATEMNGQSTFVKSI
ncbi:MAG: hypothetical protein ACOC14_02430 [Bacillota bacterium]